MQPEATFKSRPLPRSLRLLNRIGSALDAVGVRSSLEPAQLMQQAERESGLRDWGERRFQRGFERLCTSLTHDAELTPLGRLGAQKRLVRNLVQRLAWVEQKKQDAALASVPIRAPVFITGYPRTGTTLLYNLLARDARFRWPAFWESIFPLPPPEPGVADGRADEAQRIVTAGVKLTPDLQAIHELTDVRAVEEDYPLLEKSFFSFTYRMSFDVSSYMDWYYAQGAAEADAHYAEYRGWLQVLMRNFTEQRWLSKSPAYLLHVSSLLRNFPDATVIYLERDPRETVPSLCSLFATVSAASTRRVDAHELGRACTRIYSEGMQRFADAQREFAGQIEVVPYTELVRDPLAVVDRLTPRLGLDASESARAAMGSWLERSRESRVPHHYSLAQFGLDAEGLARESRSFARQAP